MLKWQDLLRIADNPTILGFLKWSLETEKKKAEDGYRGLLSLEYKSTVNPVWGTVISRMNLRRIIQELEWSLIE